MDFELIDCKGIVAAETESHLAALRSDGFVRVIHLDANLVLDSARIGAGRATPDSAALGGLLRLAAATQTSIDYDLAVAELAAGAARVGDLNRKSKLRAELSGGIRAVESHHGLRKGTVVVRRIGEAEVKSYDWVRIGYYTHLLYIEQLAKQRPGKAAAVENVATYIDWANNRLKNVSGHCLQVALDVFGGTSQAARLLAMNSSKPQESRAWNAAWDLVHAYAMHYETTRPLRGTMKRAFLATRDRALSYVAQRCVVAVYVKDSPAGDTTLVCYRIDQPFLSPHKSRIEGMIREMFEAQRSRIERGDVVTRKEMARMRDTLERGLDIRSRADAP